MPKNANRNKLYFAVYLLLRALGVHAHEATKIAKMVYVV